MLVEDFPPHFQNQNEKNLANPSKIFCNSISFWYCKRGGTLKKKHPASARFPRTSVASTDSSTLGPPVSEHAEPPMLNRSSAIVIIIVIVIIVMTPCSTTSASAENPDYVEVVQHGFIMNIAKNLLVVMKIDHYDQCNVRHILCVTFTL